MKKSETAIAMGGWVVQMQERKQGMYKALKAFYKHMDKESVESVNAVRGCLTYIESLQAVMNTINENMKM